MHARMNGCVAGWQGRQAGWLAGTQGLVKGLTHDPRLRALHLAQTAIASLPALPQR